MAGKGATKPTSLGQNTKERDSRWDGEAEEISDGTGVQGRYEEVVGTREMSNVLARWVWLSGGLAQLRRSEARLGQLVLRMLREP